MHRVALIAPHKTSNVRNIVKGFAHKEQLLKLYDNQLRALKFYKEMLKQRSLAQLSSPENKPRDLSNRAHKTRKNTVN